MTYRKKLIEVALPLEDINREAARENYIYKGNPSGIHKWWAQRPLAACRAVLFASLVDDPSECTRELLADPAKRRAATKLVNARLKVWNDATALLNKAKAAGVAAPPPGPEPKLEEVVAEIERERLFDIIRELVKWENSNNERVLQAARAEILRSCDGKPPPVYDPFCGGGSIPLEAQRLGLEAHASDLNPVPVLITKALIEIPPKFAGKPPVNPESRRQLLGAPASLPANTNEGTHAARDGGAPGAPGAPGQFLTPSFIPASKETSRVMTNVPSPEPHLGWFSRGYLPHWDHPGMIQSITFRLHDSLPHEVVECWKMELGLPLGAPASLPAKIPEKLASTDAGAPGQPDGREIELRKRIARYEDEGHGSCWLRDERIGRLVEKALLHFDGQRYRLLAWCVMPNHVHVLVETWECWPLAGVLHSWKSFTANEANKILARKGEFWQREYHDRYIRNAEHYTQAIRYLEENPVKARLVTRPTDWPFSSAKCKSPGAPASLPAKEEKGELAARDGGAPRDPSSWKGAAGLAEDIRYYGRWMRDEAEKRIGHLYPKVKVVQENDGSYRHATPDELSGSADIPVGEKGRNAGRDAGAPRVQELTVIAWLWARTVASPNPAAKGAHVPLVRSFWLSTKMGKKAWVEPVAHLGAPASQPAYHFEIRTEQNAGTDAGAPRGTVSRNGGVCLVTGSPMTLEYIRAEGKAGRLGARLMAIVADGRSGRIYLPPSEEHERIARSAKPQDFPDTDLPKEALGFRVQNYGMVKHCHLFTNRQLEALTTLSDLVREARIKVLNDSGHDQAYADGVAMYLAFAVSKHSIYGNMLVPWYTKEDRPSMLFGRQAVSMVWDFAEVNPFTDIGGSFEKSVKIVADVLDNLPDDVIIGKVTARSATDIEASPRMMFSTDPPYYDNVPYADLSDFFYVWLRRMLFAVFPTFMPTVLVPKSEELVADPFRHGGRDEARSFFEKGMGRVFAKMLIATDERFPATIYYAFKQAEQDESDNEPGGDDAGARTSTGWETFLQGLLNTGWQVGGTWPLRTERTGRLRDNASNALASSIVLVCRPRPKGAGAASRRDFLAALKKELPEALRNLQKGNIAPVDLAQAAIGPGMAVFSRYARVIETDGSSMGVRTALSLINQMLDEVLAEQEGEFDADTRWALAWFDQYGFAEGPYGVAETLSTAKNTSVSGMVEAGILEAKGGKVRLLNLGAPASSRRDAETNAPAGMPALPGRVTVWMATHYLIRALGQSETAAAELLLKLGVKGEIARDLSYRLYTICERRKWAQEAIGYNALVLAWSDVARLSQETKSSKGPSQGELI